jgi:rhodanese-related sulfurtransferase
MPKKHIPHITCEHLLTLHGAKGERSHVIVDLRERNEYEAGHIKDSLNVPRKELETNIANLLPDKAKKVIVIVGPTQEEDIHEVHDILNELGYGDVEFLAGGIDRFCEIAPLEIEELGESTPEERGGGNVGDEDAQIDPEGHDNEPLF